MSRVAQLFQRLKRQRRCGLIAYITCGDPDRATTVEIIRALEQAGADAIELGVPFSDPMADGPVIQAASQRALSKRTTIADVLGIASEVRRTSEIPLIAFSYLNPIMRYGTERFALDASASVDALLLTDLPPEAGTEIRRALNRHNVKTIFLLAPTSTDARIKLVNRMSDDFIYYVSTTGVTGARKDLDPKLLARLAEVRKKVKKALAVGFGISEHAHYEALRKKCDAIVVGSAIVRAIGDGPADGAPQRAAAVVRRILDNRAPAS
jgi:tryptophan synthase alpha chain